MLVSDAPADLTRRVPLKGAAGASPRQAVLALQSRRASARTFRHFTDDVLGRWGLSEDERDSAVLVVSELTANSAQHGRASTTLFLLHDQETLHIEVVDFGERLRDDCERADDDPAEHGRGMTIVECLAQWVEVTQNRDGHTVRVGLRGADQPLGPRPGRDRRPGAERGDGFPGSSSSAPS
ncbi:ATP-binding protein [Streptomyces sp. B3I8]|uniref:ATP-binding protein n=1 Tax=Streptomyces sp. B3I8 TaxID=3042303 RepID=UPI00358EAE5B